MYYFTGVWYKTDYDLHGFSVFLRFLKIFSVTEKDGNHDSDK